MSSQHIADIIDRLITVLEEVKDRALELETNAPVVDPESVRAAASDPDPFARLFGRDRGVFYKKRLETIEGVIKELRTELVRLRRESGL